MTVRRYAESDVGDLVRIWNEVVEEGVAFPQEEFLDEESGAEFFGAQSYTGVAESNARARRLYKKLGFIQLGTIPGGFRMKDGHYENICPYYRVL